MLFPAIWSDQFAPTLRWRPESERPKSGNLAGEQRFPPHGYPPKRMEQMARNLIVAVVIAAAIVLALFLLLRPQGGTEGQGQPPHATAPQ